MKEHTTVFPTRKKNLFLGGVGIVILLLVAGIVWFSTGMVVSETGLIDGDEILVISTQTGIPEIVHIREGDTLQPGDPVLSMDLAPLEAAVIAARAEFEQIRSLMEPVRGPAVAGASLPPPPSPRESEDAARRLVEQLSVNLAKAQLERRKLSLQDPPVSAEQIAAALAVERSAETALAHAQVQLERASATRAGLIEPEETLAAAPENTDIASEDLLSMLAARVQEAEATLAAATVTSPATGIVRTIGVSPGMSVAKGSPIAGLTPLDPEHLWVITRFDAQTASRLQPGMPAKIRPLRSEGERTVRDWKGYVYSLEPLAADAHAAEQPDNGENAQDAAPATLVRLRFLPGNITREQSPQPGVPVRIAIETHHPRVDLPEQPVQNP